MRQAPADRPGKTKGNNMMTNEIEVGDLVAYLNCNRVECEGVVEDIEGFIVGIRNGGGFRDAIDSSNVTKVIRRAGTLPPPSRAEMIAATDFSIPGSGDVVRILPRQYGNVKADSWNQIRVYSATPESTSVQIRMRKLDGNKRSGVIASIHLCDEALAELADAIKCVQAYRAKRNAPSGDDFVPAPKGDDTPPRKPTHSELSYHAKKVFGLAVGDRVKVKVYLGKRGMVEITGRILPFAGTLIRVRGDVGGDFFVNRSDLTKIEKDPTDDGQVGPQGDGSEHGDAERDVEIDGIRNDPKA